MGLWDSFLDRFRKTYDLQDLMKATTEILGKGTYGTVYKASMDSGVAVAVKRLSQLKGLMVSDEEFREKMDEIGRFDHENLVPLRAFYFTTDLKLLIYDYFPLGSLSALLHGNREADRIQLNWETRAKIALGTARGVQYIHAQGPTFCHGNIKSSNIFLSKNNEARVYDFGVAQMVSPWKSPYAANYYRAPEVRNADDSNKVSQKADVYSFGVFLLELLTGKSPMAGEKLTFEGFDMELLRYSNVKEEMGQLLQLAVDCTGHDPEKRPTMAQVTPRIEQICGCSSSSSVKPRERDHLNLKVAPQDLSLPPRRVM